MTKKVEKKKGSALGAAVFCLLTAYLAFSGHVTTTGTVSGSHSSCLSLERLWVRNGGSVSSKFVAAEVAMAESSGNENATHYNSDGSVDRGYWQINSVHGALSVYGPDENARAAIVISSDGTDWQSWTTYRNGDYKGRCLQVSQLKRRLSSSWTI